MIYLELKSNFFRKFKQNKKDLKKILKIFNNIFINKTFFFLDKIIRLIIFI